MYWFKLPIVTPSFSNTHKAIQYNLVNLEVLKLVIVDGNEESLEYMREFNYILVLLRFSFFSSVRFWSKKSVSVRFGFCRHINSKN
jgi:hypothetical protein